MTKKLNLRELVEHMDFQIEEFSNYVNIQTGEVVSISNDILLKVEDDEIDLDNHPEWEHEMIHEAIDLLENDGDYIEVPSKYEINEYGIMEDFAFNVKPDKVSDKLSRAIQGRGAFRRFKDTIDELGVTEEWYKYKRERLKEMAIKWCQRNGIEYREE
ncbi:UPF0158 family protein [Evansella cellulosilytica]|uniref:Uncharacterized protein n=1 Tax=Evansella cellulosilytica (strain ATCC 21833 / DSM 2522 / FERM P-1141 / JCM 9156 / N-4) TaxID=649639 RepID=E6TSN9_EVAC2|nr:UPF0158 family protein [Evansella cellulosilytica]ADU29547.1 hypothetical protein Bcell_1282 [Evansella cellulosilytica DSM 2522]